MKSWSTIGPRLVIILILINVQHLKCQWSLLGLGNQEISTVIADPRNPGIIYAASISDFTAGTVGKLFKSTDGGATWDTLGPRASFQTLSMDPDSSNVIYAGLGVANFGTPGILKTTDGGQTWFHADSGLAPEGVVDITIDKRNPQILFAGLVQMLGGFLYKSRNGGHRWYPVVDSTPEGQGGLATGVLTIAIDPDSESVMYAGGGSLGDLMKSVDSGETWRFAIPRFTYATQMVYGSRGNDMYMGAYSSSAYPKGMLHSTDGGVTWVPIVAGLPGNYFDVRALQRLEYIGQECLFIAGVSSISLPSTGVQFGVFMSTDSGNTWQDLGLDSVSLTSLALSPDGRTVYVGGLGRYQGWPSGVYARSVVVSVGDTEQPVAQTFRLYPSYPNPFNPSTTLTYDLDEPTRVTAAIYSIEGRRIRSLVNCTQEKGRHAIEWDGRDDRGIESSTGIYLFQLQTFQPGTARTGLGTTKVVLVR